MNDLISWCKCGGRRASLFPLAPWGQETVSHGLCFGSWACHNLFSRVIQCSGVCFYQVRDAVTQTLCYIPQLREAGGWVGSFHTRRPDSSQGLSHKQWDACLSVAWSLVSGLQPRRQADQVSTHSLEWVRLLPQRLRKGTSQSFLKQCPQAGRALTGTCSFQRWAVWKFSSVWPVGVHLMFLPALPGQNPVEFAKNGSTVRRKYYLHVSNLGYRWEMMSKFDF